LTVRVTVMCDSVGGRDSDIATVIGDDDCDW